MLRSSQLLDKCLFVTAAHFAPRDTTDCPIAMYQDRFSLLIRRKTGWLISVGMIVFHHGQIERCRIRLREQQRMRHQSIADIGKNFLDVLQTGQLNRVADSSI